MKNQISNSLLKKVIPKSGKNRFFFFTGIGIFILAFIWFFTGKQSKSFATFIVEKGDFVISVTESGELKSASNFTVVTPRIYGKLQIVQLAPEGTTIKEGDLLVQFDPTEMIKKITDKQNEMSITQSDIKKTKADQLANMARLEAEVDNARISYELSLLNVERMKFESESQQKQAQLELERNKNSYEGSKQKITSQKIIDQSDLNKLAIKMQQIKGDIESAKKDVETLSVRAKLPGLVVYEYNWSTGKKIAIGDSPWSGMPLISLPDLFKIQVLTSVNEVDVSKVKMGQSVKLKLDAFPDKKFSGKVASVATIGKNKEQGSSVKIFEVIIDVEGVDPVFKPGMTTSNEIITEVIKDAVYVPLESVFEKDNKTVVYKVASSPTPHEVKLGKKNADFVVIEEGINPGDRVTLRDPTIETGDESATPVKQKETKSANQPSGGVRIMVR